MKTQKEIMRDMTFSRKVSHIWYYYKWFILGTIFIVGCIISLIVSIVSQKEVVLNVVIADNITEEGPRFIIKGMSERLHIDEKQEVLVDTSIHMDDKLNGSTVIYDSIEKFNTLIVVGDYDVVIDEGIVPQNYSGQDAIMDLRTLMTKEQQKKFRDRFYIKKDSEGNEIVAGLFIDGLPWTEDAKLLKEKPLVSVPSTTTHRENAKEMLQWILTY